MLEMRCGTETCFSIITRSTVYYIQFQLLNHCHVCICSLVRTGTNLDEKKKTGKEKIMKHSIKGQGSVNAYSYLHPFE